MNMPLNSAKLTKKLLAALPQGLFLVSNLMKTPTEPIFAETIRPGPQRQDQWRRIVALGANGRLCHVFQSPEAAQAHFAILTGVTLDPARN